MKFSTKFSTRDLFWLMLLVCAIGGWIADRRWQEQQALSGVTRLGEIINLYSERLRELEAKIKQLEE